MPDVKSTAIDLMFEGMEKLGPGDDTSTLDVLRALPQSEFSVIVDAGCGTGRQTLALAGELRTPIQAVDTYRPFLDDLIRRAASLGVSGLVQTHCMDMKDIPAAFPAIDLLWSEGAAYNIGFANALDIWASALGVGALAVVSELSWLREAAPEHVTEFFASGYPDMRSVSENVTTAESMGYRVLDTYTLPRSAWTEGFYNILEPRAKRLIDHSDPDVSDFATEMLKEIEVFESSDDSYGYTFYALQRHK
jgi:SAM-dependent methyltransferase